jgi:hypothetical protein
MIRKQSVATLFAIIAVAVIASSAAAQPADHLKCYKMKDPLKLSATADLNTPSLGLDPNCRISKAKFLCVPGSKTNVTAIDKATGNPISLLPIGGANPGKRVCYKIKCQAQAPDQPLTDQFGARTVGKLKASLLCTPASTTTTITIPTTTSTTTSITAIPNDFDADGVLNETDNCVFIPNPAQTDTDSDLKGDACDDCPNDPNPGNDPCP